MNTTFEFEVNTAELTLIKNLKNQIDEIYQEQAIFGLSLETLELTRRFSESYPLVTNLNEVDPIEFNKFISLSRHLERNLLQELK
ncbi:hypothetical protein [Gillisia limnaea]|uniref:Uncharacterized protein n=1 Tax=Gillisia limnaea (strain DSM 15749 / LMG 21470 / R-8282) TaxID=865937 RepID=H2BUZ9_GILLR|nr:hypothetical protein [Gillisia limnaea]EHQ03889.1 hypothetical protein Gilli_3283 [Gillisia limnaea DSM 15749]